MTKKEFLIPFLKMCAIYDKQQTKILAGAWYDLVSQYEIKIFEHEIKKFLEEDESGFFPVPAKIIKRLQERSADVMAGEEAWMVAKCIVNNNWDSEPWRGIDCKIMRRTCEAVGYDGFDNTKNLGFAKKRFIETYEAMTRPAAILRMQAIESGATPAKVVQLCDNLFNKKLEA